MSANSSSSSRKNARLQTEASPPGAGTIALAQSMSSNYEYSEDSNMDVVDDEKERSGSQQPQQPQIMPQQPTQTPGGDFPATTPAPAPPPQQQELKSFLQKIGLEEKSEELLALRNDPVFVNAPEEQRIGHLKISLKTDEEQAKEVAQALLGGTSGGNSSDLCIGRGPKIVDGLETELVHNLDLNEFMKRIDNLFKWHADKTVREEYTAPYFALVQSSGMGKTKLFSECRKLYNKNESGTNRKRRCMTILCVDAKLPEEQRKKYYDHILLVDMSTRDIVDTVRARLNKLLPPDGDCDDLVLLFDEAHGLMKGIDEHGRGSLVFRSIRWWLREERKINVVASFAGTNAKLSNFHRPDPPKQGVSRLAVVSYKNYVVKQNDDKKLYLYPPFFELNTISCFTAKEPLYSDSAIPGFPQASTFGRPLFAYYHSKGELDDAKLAEFALRLVLSAKNYDERLPSCYSVLGARVQMGIVNSFDTLSTLVSAGYACLVDFQQQENSDSAPSARLTFMPDPLCAFLAMKYMDKDWKGLGFHGKCGRFWVKQAEKAFSTKLCLPEKGDAGEIFAALYMLLCGDILRKKKDKSLESFAVSIDEWFRLLKYGGKHDAASRDAASAEGASADAASLVAVTKAFLTDVTTRSGETRKEVMTDAAKSASESNISFVQVCRNDFRVNSFCEERVLKHMYISGLANYAYKNCKAIDIASAIKVVRNSQTSYHPLLISVKNWATVTKGDVAGWLSSLMAFLQEMRQGKEQGQPSSVCLLILLGCLNPPTMRGDNLDSDDLVPFPLDDVYRLVSVPETDEFGVSEAISKLGAVSEKCEIYSSHGFLGYENTADSLLRKKSPNQNLITDLFKALRVSDTKTE